MVQPVAPGQLIARAIAEVDAIAVRRHVAPVTIVVAAIIAPAIVAPAVVAPPAPTPVVVPAAVVVAPVIAVTVTVVATPVVAVVIAVVVTPVVTVIVPIVAAPVAAIIVAVAIPMVVATPFRGLGQGRRRLPYVLAALTVVIGCRGTRKAQGQRGRGEDLLVHNGTSA